MVLIWVTCQPQEQSLWAKGELLSERGGGVGAKHWPPENSHSDTQEKGIETSYDLPECPSWQEYKKVIKLMKLRDVPFACQMEKWRKTRQAKGPL